MALAEWSAVDVNGVASDAPALGDWTVVRQLERFSGTLVYRTSVALLRAPAAAELDLGRVGEAAEVFVNGRAAGFALWAPYRIALGPALLRAGRNEIEVRVTNSAANHFEGALRPSGLMGPVSLRLG